VELHVCDFEAEAEKGISLLQSIDPMEALGAQALATQYPSLMWYPELQPLRTHSPYS